MFEVQQILAEAEAERIKLTAAGEADRLHAEAKRFEPKQCSSQLKQRW